MSIEATHETVRETALGGLHARYGNPLRHGNPDAVELCEQPLVGLVNLRVDPASSIVRHAMQQALALEFPQSPNTVAQGRDAAALWLAPDEWLLRTGTEAQAADIVARVEQALAGQWFAVTEQSSGFAVLQLRGPRARDVLNSGCPLDLHPRVMPLGTCAQSHFFKAGIVLRPLDPDTWELIVRRSFADYTVQLLLDAMQ